MLIILRQLIVLFLALSFVSAAFAQGTDADWQGHMAFSLEMERLGREGHLTNPLVLLDLECSGEETGCEPLVRMFVKTANLNQHRIPLLPTVALKEGALQVDKARFKAEKKGGVLEAACAKLPVPDMCEGKWALRKIWKVNGVSAESFDLSLKTQLLRPGAASTQIGSRTAEQVLILRIPMAPIQERVVIPLWEQGGVLNMPETYSAR